MNLFQQTGETLVDAIQEVLSDIPNVSIYLQGQINELKSPRFGSFTDVMPLMSEAQIEKSVREQVTFLTPAIFIYTSGTTGSQSDLLSFVFYLNVWPVYDLKLRMRNKRSLFECAVGKSFC